MSGEKISLKCTKALLTHNRAMLFIYAFLTEKKFVQKQYIFVIFNNPFAYGIKARYFYKCFAHRLGIQQLPYLRIWY